MIPGEKITSVRSVDVQIPFASMVVLLVKVSIAAIPAGITEPNALGTPIAAAANVALPPAPVTAVTCRSASADRG